MKPNREDALNLFLEYNTDFSLIKHGFAVEAVMLHFAELYEVEDKEKWGIIGLVHDIDYEKYPDLHCVAAEEILRKAGWDEDYIHAVISHGYGICVDVKPVHKMEKVLYTIDELTGLITATVYMRPSKSIMDLELKSVKKKFKQKNFAAGVNREIIKQGAEMLEEELDYIIIETINGMKKAADKLDLAGS